MTEIAESLLEGMDLPERAMPVACVRVVSYIDPEDGKHYVQWKFDGEQSVSQTVGDLERVQLSYLMEEGEFDRE